MKPPSDTNLIVGCAVPFGEPECETGGPKQEIPLYKNGPSRDSGSRSQRWSRLERGGSEPRSAESDRSGRAYLTALLHENREGDGQVQCINKTAEHLFTVYVEYTLIVVNPGRFSLDSEHDREQSNLCRRGVTCWQPPGSG